MLTEISEAALGHVQELGVLLHAVLRLVQLQYEWPTRHDPFQSKHRPKTIKFRAQKNMIQ